MPIEIHTYLPTYLPTHPGNMHIKSTTDKTHNIRRFEALFRSEARNCRLDFTFL
ncbi:hypothetical protein BofuT4_uP068000.1 [Botrytis cinerea T4]|uniref:Uncharacterized protein n=1 Tax=Botryotinia fuckeliana (strain T4) TaxID=999810 RepID=G2XQW7_BOTF4|nr:hypothetical protein BofuT4_uP068000.1 [Botrytis cinerea T4]